MTQYDTVMLCIYVKLYNNNAYYKLMQMIEYLVDLIAADYKTMLLVGNLSHFFDGIRIGYDGETLSEIINNTGGWVRELINPILKSLTLCFDTIQYLYNRPPSKVYISYVCFYSYSNCHTDIVWIFLNLTYTNCKFLLECNLCFLV